MSEQPIAIHYQQMEEWLNDRKSVFERQNKNVFRTLLALAPKLVAQVQYDIPALQKQMKKCTNSIEESHRVCEDVDRVVASTAEKQHKLLCEYGLLLGGGGGGGGVDAPGNGVELQVAIERRIEESRRALTGELLGFATAHLSGFKGAYNGVLARLFEEATDAVTDRFATHFPWLEQLLQERSLLVADEVGMGQENGKGEEEEEEEQGGLPPQIDWGDDPTADLSPSTLGQEERANAVEINWDAGDGWAPSAGHGSGSALNEEEAEEAATTMPPAGNGRHITFDIARVKDRANLLTELSGCRCFAGERREMKDNSYSAFQSAVDTLVTALTSSVEAELVRMRANFRERDALEERIARFDRMISAAHMRKASHEAKHLESKEELGRLEPQLDALRRAATANRDECLRNLSVLFPGRNILIVGDINKYL